MIKQIIFLLVVALCVQSAHAEKADSEKPLHIWAESQTYDGKKKVTVYTGSVRLEKGTLRINAARLEVSENPNGGKIAILFSDPGKWVNYRQKRDGGPNLWAEGEAEKVVYDDTLGIIKLFNQAKLVLLEGDKRTHESSGVYISYNSHTDFMSVNNTLEGVSSPGAGFTNAVIYPTNDKTKTSLAPAKSESRSKPDANPKSGVKAQEKSNGITSRSDSDSDANSNQDINPDASPKATREMPRIIHE